MLAIVPRQTKPEIKVECLRIFDGTLHVKYGQLDLGNLPCQTSLTIDILEDFIAGVITKINDQAAIEADAMMAEINTFTREVNESPRW